MYVASINIYVCACMYRIMYRHVCINGICIYISIYSTMHAHRFRTVGCRRLIQRYIPSPLLLEGRKFDLRVYMLVASYAPLTAYYHDGYVRRRCDACVCIDVVYRTFVCNIVIFHAIKCIKRWFLVASFVR